MVFSKFRLFGGGSISFLLGYAAGNIDFLSSSHSLEKEIVLSNQTSRRSSDWIRKNSEIDFNVSLEKKSHLLEPILIKLLKGEIPGDWEGELEKILDFSTQGVEREKVLVVFFTKWAEIDFDNAVKRASKLGLEAHTVKNEIFNQLAQKNPESALLYYEKNKNDLVNYPYFLNNMARSWAQKSPDEALNWCLSSFKPPQSHGILLSFLEGVIPPAGENEIKKYVDLIMSRHGYVPNNVMERWAEISPDEAISWMDPSSEKDGAYQRAVIKGIAKNDLNKAEEMLMELPEKERRFLIPSISSSIKNIYGEEMTLSWVTKLVSPSELNESLLVPLVSWSRSNPDISLEWVKSLPSSSGKDAAILVYANNVTSFDLYDSTLDLINNMNDSQKKEIILKKTIRQWRESNVDSFGEWEKKSRYGELINSSR